VAATGGIVSLHELREAACVSPFFIGPAKADCVTFATSNLPFEDLTP